MSKSDQLTLFAEDSPASISATAVRKSAFKVKEVACGEIRPRYVVVENVAALLYRGMGDVIGDLAALGYDAEWHCIPADIVGADQERERVWIVAYGQEQRSQSILIESGLFQAAIADSARLARDCRTFYSTDARRVLRETQPGLDRVSDDVPARVDRIAALGNAVVPQIPEIIGRAILEIEAANNGDPRISTT